MPKQRENDWQQLWDARLAALEIVLGKSADRVLHGVIPFQFGYEVGGEADILFFHNHVDGVAYVTADLIGNEDQRQSEFGSYELMVCHRKENDWGPRTIGQLAHYTLDAVINRGDTMNLGPATPEGSCIEALLYDEYATFDVLGERAGLMLCIGITSDELDECRQEGSASVLQKLKAADIYPFTDFDRVSMV
jgi:hypothetical protein